jgi:hypothetical protein
MSKFEQRAQISCRAMCRLQDHQLKFCVSSQMQAAAECGYHATAGGTGHLIEQVSAAVAQLEAALQDEDVGAAALNQLVRCSGSDTASWLEIGMLCTASAEGASKTMHLCDVVAWRATIVAAGQWFPGAGHSTRCGIIIEIDSVLAAIY